MSFDDYEVLIPYRTYDLIGFFMCSMLLWWGAHVMQRLLTYLELRQAIANDMFINLGAGAPYAEVLEKMAPHHMQRLRSATTDQQSLRMPPLEAPATVPSQKISVRCDPHGIAQGRLRLWLDFAVAARSKCCVQVLFGVPEAAFTQVAQQRIEGSSAVPSMPPDLPSLRGRFGRPSFPVVPVEEPAGFEMRPVRALDDQVLLSCVAQLRSAARYHTDVHTICASSDGSAVPVNFATPKMDVYDIPLDDVYASNGEPLMQGEDAGVTGGAGTEPKLRAGSEGSEGPPEESVLLTPPAVAGGRDPVTLTDFINGRGFTLQNVRGMTLQNVNDDEGEEKSVEAAPLLTGQPWFYETTRSQRSDLRIPALILVWDFGGQGEEEAPRPRQPAAYGPYVGLKKRVSEPSSVSPDAQQSRADSLGHNANDFSRSFLAVKVQFKKVGPKAEPSLQMNHSDQYLVATDAVVAVQDIFGSGNEDENEECVICFSEKCSMLLLPCRHLSVCGTCFAQIDKCPVCRTTFDGYCVLENEDAIADGAADEEKDQGADHLH
uniref:RING-type domain-containing protein n=1 Tax=Phaeomonas parva TaxID=124430 RepID=A0A7S1TVT3_9STRA|mmetsp:Transcript_19534/g.59089  ORF Transcript_19534/g.59089 Transcript_19534/m.59089 type:complete len:546 (+) Transcript_19534:311-1948(+)